MRDEILVTGYIDPDLDSLACTFAYTYFLNKTGERALSSISGIHHEEAEHVLKEYNVGLEVKTYNPEDFEKIILVDASDQEAIDNRIDPNKVIEIIDHRRVNMADCFPNAKVQIEKVGAAATLIAEKFVDKNVDFTKEFATLIYGAIISNTLNFKANVTTDRDRKIAKILKDEFGFSDDFAHKMFLAKSDFSGDKAVKAVRGDFANFGGFDFGVKVGIGQIEMIGGEKLAMEKKDEIVQELNSITKEKGLDIAFLSIVDLEANQNVFVVPTQEAADLLERIFKIKTENHIAIRPGLIMRKEIVPLIKEQLEKE